MRRGEIWWADLAPAPGRVAGRRRPLLIVSADEFNASAIPTVVTAAISSDERLAEAPGNVRLVPSDSGLGRPAVVDVAALRTVHRAALSGRVATLPGRVMRRVDEGIRLALAVPLRPAPVPAPAPAEPAPARAPASPPPPRSSTGFVRSSRSR